MSESRFKIVFNGALLPGVEIGTAQLKVAKLFKSDVAAIEPLFKGQNITLKRDLSQSDAQIYLEALHNTGIDPRIEPDLAPGPREPEAQSSKLESTPIVRPAVSTIVPVDTVPAAASIQQSPSPTSTAQPYASESPYTPPQAAVGEALPEFGELKFYGVQGRIGRLRYLAWSLVLLLVITIPGAFTMAALIGSGHEVMGVLLLAAMSIAFVFLNTTISVQRLHDLGWSGWLWLLNLVVWPILPLLIAVLPGNSGPNRYGAPQPPNSPAVKVLSGLWVVVLVLTFIGAIAG